MRYDLKSRIVSGDSPQTPISVSLLFLKNLLFYIVEETKGRLVAVKVKKLTLMALLTAIALTIFMIEAQIPAPVPIPGIKLGLANIVTAFAVFALGPKDAAAILFVRIFLGAVFAGNFSTIFYSAAGGLCAIAVTIAVRRILTKDQIWIAGVLGSIAHCIGQMAMAVLLTATPGLAVYLPWMVGVGIFTGAFTGKCAQYLTERLRLA